MCGLSSFGKLHRSGSTQMGLILGSYGPARDAVPHRIDGGSSFVMASVIGDGDNAKDEPPSS